MSAKNLKEKLASDKSEAQKIADICDKSKTKIAEIRKTQAIIVKAVESQTDYERRFYKRDFHHDASLTIVENCTNKTTNQIIDEFVQYVVATHKTSFMTNDLILAFETHGSSYGDIVRSAMRKLKTIKAVRVVNIKRRDSNKNLYKYIVNTESELFRDFFKKEV